MSTLTITESPTSLRVREGLIILLSSLLLAISARISVYLPFSPVPIALHPTMAIFLGVVLGPRRAAMAVTLYLLEGTAGLPVFSAGGCGPLYLMGPTGGYLLGFVPATYLAGSLARSYHHPFRQWMALMAATAVIYVCGAFQLAQFVGRANVLAVGVLPFIPGCLFKSFVLSYGGASLHRLLNRG